MKFKYYIVALFVFIVLLGLYVYSLSGETYTYTYPFTQNSITLPVAVWFILPVVVFFIVVVCLEIGGAYRMWRKRTKYKNDYRLILEQLESQLLQKKFSHQPTMNRYKSLSILLSNLTFDIKDGIPLKSGDARLDELISLLGDIKRGEFVSLKKFNPNEKCPFVLQNTANRIKADDKFAIEILKKSSSSEENKRDAFKKLLDNENLIEAKKYIEEVQFNKDLANTTLNMCYTKKMNFSNEEIAALCSKVKYTKQDYIVLAQKIKVCYEPDAWVGLFEFLANKDEVAEIAYFYVLLELEMLEVAKERLSTHPQNEFLKVRAYLDLKNLGKKYPLELFLLD
ncbi:MAG: hypothetical protein SOW25_04320 [Helicobacter sp.]|nr:hypothetical protein [Helicobacter sp.]